MRTETRVLNLGVRRQVKLVGGGYLIYKLHTIQVSNLDSILWSHLPPLVWTSNDSANGFQSQGGFHIPVLFCCEVGMIPLRWLNC